MFSVCQIATRHLLTKSTYAFGFGGKRKPTPSDLQKYDVVVVGAHLGNVLATHLDAIVGEKQKIFCAFDNPTIYNTSQRNLYEQGNLTKFQFGGPTRPFLCANNGKSDYIGVDKFNPDNNQIILRNGRSIKYESLVIAMGQKENYNQIKGFDEAWADPFHPFYANMDHPSWRTSCVKSYRVHLNFNGGDAFFYIPPNNFYGQIQDYNFLVSKDRFDLTAKTGKISWETSKFTVVNPNKTFSKYVPRVDEFLRETCQKNNINIEENLLLVEVKPNENTVVFKDLTTGELVSRRYGFFYSLLPTTTHTNLSEAGLADSTGYLDVEPDTLRHRKYDNIFGLGDVLNVPTTKTFYGGVNQMHVVKKNLLRRLNGLPLSEKYDGYAKATLPLSTHSMAVVEHKYGGEGLNFSTDSFTTSLNWKLYSLKGKHNHENILKFKTNDQYVYKFNKIFGKEEGSVVTSQAPAELQPEKKSA